MSRRRGRAEVGQVYIDRAYIAAQEHENWPDSERDWYGHGPECAVCHPAMPLTPSRRAERAEVAKRVVARRRPSGKVKPLDVTPSRPQTPHPSRTTNGTGWHDVRDGLSTLIVCGSVLAFLGQLFAVVAAIAVDTDGDLAIDWGWWWLGIAAEIVGFFVGGALAPVSPRGPSASTSAANLDKPQPTQRVLPAQTTSVQAAAVETRPTQWKTSIPTQAERRDDWEQGNGRGGSILWTEAELRRGLFLHVERPGSVTQYDSEYPYKDLWEPYQSLWTRYDVRPGDYQINWAYGYRDRPWEPKLPGAKDWPNWARPPLIARFALGTSSHVSYTVLPTGEWLEIETKQYWPLIFDLFAELVLQRQWELRDDDGDVIGLVRAAPAFRAPEPGTRSSGAA